MLGKFHYIFIFLILGVRLDCHPDDTYKDFVIIVASYNNAKYYKINLDSILSQDYPKNHFRIIYVDDCSSDKTAQKVRSYCKKHNFSSNLNLIQHKKRTGALKSRYDAIHSCKNSEIAIILDGDDWLFDQNVLKKLNNTYQDNDVWLTYGQYIRWCDHCEGQIYPANFHQTPQCKHEVLGWCRELPIDEIIQQNYLREYVGFIMNTLGGWVMGHLRTFYVGLFKQINPEDLTTSNGYFYTSATDVATMIPLAEMAGTHVRFISDILYVYNRANPLNLSKTKRRRIRSQRGFSPIGFTLSSHKKKYSPLRALPK